MGVHIPTPADLPAVFSRIGRDQLGEFIEVAIDYLDALDGDPDVELNGDELDGTGAEDDFMRHRHNGPGCPIADPDAAVEDFLCDAEAEDGL